MTAAEPGRSAKVYGIRSVAETLREADAKPYLRLMVERFGMAPEAFEPYFFFKPKDDALWIINRDLRLPERPEPFVLGMPFFRLDMRYPRPSTNAVLKFGHLATRHRVELRADEVPHALYRRDLQLSEERCRDFESNGYVLTFYRGRPFGLGYYSPTESADGSGLLKTHCPKIWAGNLGVSPPAQRPLPWDEPESL